jgi:hypothetical protein
VGQEEVRLYESLKNSERSSNKKGVLMEEMRLYESLKNSEKSLDKQGVLTEEDQKCILIIGGIKIFMPSIPIEGSACIEGAEEERQSTVNVIKQEKEKTVKSFQEMEKEEHSMELLKIFSKGDE